MSFISVLELSNLVAHLIFVISGIAVTEMFQLGGNEAICMYRKALQENCVVKFADLVVRRIIR